ncbi:MAG: helix-turn-helix domain-containing protein [Candidatus Rhabdochlamydia sp.]
MEEELKQLGEILRAKREASALSLNDVKNALSIGEGVLALIEAGLIGEKFAPVYVQGFLKQYAHFLKLDTEELLLHYPHIFQKKFQRHEFAYGIGTLKMHTVPQRKTRGVKTIIFKILGMGASLWVIGYCVWLFLDYLRLI